MIYPVSLKLDSHSDLLKSLESLAFNEQRFGYILSIVGNLSSARFQCPGKKEATYVKDHLEIITLNGTISREKCHLHISVSDGMCNVWAGHLEEGTIILKGADILVGFIDAVNIEQRYNIKNKKIDVYIITDCPWSQRAIRMLRTLQIPHNVKLIENDIDFNSLRDRSNYSKFPQIFIEDTFIGGYSELAELHASGELLN